MRLLQRDNLATPQCVQRSEPPSFKRQPVLLSFDLDL